MTGRKPPRISWESWVDRQIREGIERGEFDDLPGAGRPLADLDGPHDELWWVRKIVYINSHATPGPPSTVMALDPDRVLADWRTTHLGSGH
jgi:hypothetical protein